ncbi:hypothetical protein VCRA2122O339_190021 [Vibrio crassostreae]|nr:hypothetical protein VCRA2120E331_90076 [Vibrio crassostreae]CAK3153508.1 hypothetical protein VCRA2120E330_100076 [Vibrio crassostreae]CAK3302690.1 hypothetical protein VCRA2122O339_190021 [Vibrio crassostreae]CAK3644585.1 hypothetical protein VCRA2127O345_90076 [Vibrio crassostreae]CAK3681682.1 hypothetical protein VCRA2122O338_90076 [Vibrio crassostreae]
MAFCTVEGLLKCYLLLERLCEGGSVDVTNMSFEIGGQESIYCFSTVSESNYESFFFKL